MPSEKEWDPVTDIVDTIQEWDSRLNWDEYFMSIAFLTASRSSCSRLQVGCVLTIDNRIISTGYNGHISGAPHVSIIRDDHEQSTIHAEQNAISDAAKRGIKLDGATAYITHYPCINCFKIMVQSGVKTIKYLADYKNDTVVNTLVQASGVRLIKLKS